MPAAIPQPGPQQPQKYPRTGGNYAQYGEQAGYVYNPYDDEYYIDRNAYSEYAIASGQLDKPKKPPGLAESLIPVAAVGGATIAGQALGGEIVPGIKGLFGLGEAAKPAVANAATQTASAFSPAATNALAGLPSGAVGSTVTASGAPGYIMADGSIVAAEGSGLFSLGGIGSAGNAFLPAAGAYGAYDLLTNDYGAGRGALQGAASGAPIGSFFGPPGAAIGAGIGGLFGLGKSLLGGDEDKWKTERDRLGKLSEQGVYIPPQVIQSMPTKGRSKDELINKNYAPDFIGHTPDGGWVNNKFAESRDVRDLRGADIVNYSSFAEKDPEWFKKPLQERIAYSQQLLDAGAVKEHHGTIDIDWGKAEKGGLLGLGQQAVAATAAVPGKPSALPPPAAPPGKRDPRIDYAIPISTTAAAPGLMGLAEEKKKKKGK